MQLQTLDRLKIKVDPIIKPFTKALWRESFSHAKHVTALQVPSKLIPSLAAAISPEKTHPRLRVSQLVFPRLAVVLIRGPAERDLFHLRRARQKRAPNDRTLGAFNILADACPGRERPRPRVVCVKSDGERAIVELPFEPVRRHIRLHPLEF